MKRPLLALGLVVLLLAPGTPAHARTLPTAHQALRALPGPATVLRRAIARAPYGYDEATRKVYRYRGYTAKVGVYDARCDKPKRTDLYTYCDVEYLAYYRDGAHKPAGDGLCDAFVRFRYAKHSRS